MRRAMAATVVGGLVLGGVTATSAFAATAAQTTTKTTAKTIARTTVGASAEKVAMKTVVYRGYEFRVPASWPVYRLDQYPTTCVRYDVHAVYLGTPGVNMQCPAGLVGRTQTVSVIPSTTVAAGSGSEVTDQREQPDGLGGTELRRLPSVRGAVTLNAAQHELRVALGAASLGATVLATYGMDPAVVEQVLGTLRAAPTRVPQTAQSAPSPALSRPSTGRASIIDQGAGVSQESAPAHAAPAHAAPAPAPARKSGSHKPRAKNSGKPSSGRARAATAGPATTTSWSRVPADWPVQIVEPQPRLRPVFHPLNGFDSCTTPSLATMRVWRQQYAAIGVYIGGANDACAYGNLSTTWLESAAGMGWGMLPTYVGPQAPCWTYTGQGIRIDPTQAASEGQLAGADAVSDAKIFGLAVGSPIYYDMEGYGSDQSCKTTVLRFLGAWDRTVAAAGYLTGVYSSQDSGIANMQAAVAAKTAGFTAPDAIWIALWDHADSLTDGTLSWPLDERSKQYWGNIYATVGGITLNIDSDIVGGPVAR
jgi:Domain of unknown function (DUF1906)